VAQKPADGLQAVAKLPAIASGRGSLIDFRLQFPKLLFRNEAGEFGVPAQTLFRGSQSVPCKANG